MCLKNSFLARQHPKNKKLKATYHCSHSLHRTAALLAACPDLTLSFQDRNCILGWGRPGAGWEHKQETNCLKNKSQATGCIWSEARSVCFLGHFIQSGFLGSLADILSVEAEMYKSRSPCNEIARNIPTTGVSCENEKWTSHRLEMNNKWSSSSEIRCVWDPPPFIHYIWMGKWS